VGCIQSSSGNPQRTWKSAVYSMKIASLLSFIASDTILVCSQRIKKLISS
jgi:hypothetical protein